VKVASAKFRYFSLLIDFLLFNDFMVLIILVLWLFTPLNNVFTAVGGRDMFENLSRLVYTLLFVLFYFTKGMSPANALFSFKVQEIGGGKQSFKTKLVRLIFASTLFSFATIPFNTKRKGFQDSVAGTEVLQGKINPKKLVIVLAVLSLLYFVPFLF